MKDATILTKEQIQDIENVVGYTFNNKALLEQAFIKNDYVNEHKGYQSSEVIEYYGDRALEITVTKELYKRLGKINDDGRYQTFVPDGTTFTEISEGVLTNLRNSIVSTTPLKNRIKELLLSKYMIFGGKLSSEEIIYDGKILADLFESICGAIAIDCDWDYENMEKHILSFLDFDNIYKSAIEYRSTNLYFIQWYYDKFGHSPSYNIIKDDDLPDISGELCVEGETDNIWFFASGDIEDEIESDMYNQAYQKLFVEKEVYRLFPDEIKKVFKDTWLKPTLNNAINIVQEMEQKGIIKNINYEFKENGNDENGDPLWECKVNYAYNDDDYGSVTHRGGKSKTESKKMAAYSLIQSIFVEYYYSPEK